MTNLYEPIATLTGLAAEFAVTAGRAMPLRGNPSLAFSQVLDHSQTPPRLLDLAEMRSHSLDSNAALATLSKAPPPFGGLDLSQPRIMGIINVTPDSFSDGGEAMATSDAISRSEAMLDVGADLIDVGGESTRPGSDPVPPEEEWRRVAPVIAELVKQGVRVSLDSRNAFVMQRAIDAGVRIINDVSALNHDAAALPLVAKMGVAVILMHMRGDPKTMNRAPHYEQILPEILGELEAAVKLAQMAGVKRENIMVDPGIGFAKNSLHNQTVLSHLGLFHCLGLPVLLGASRKGLLAGERSRLQTPQQRLGSSLAAVLRGMECGVQMVRVHDAFETAQAIEVWQAISGR